MSARPTAIVLGPSMDGARGATVPLALPGVMAGRQVQPDVEEIAFPLEPGRYLVMNCGHHSLLNAHFLTLDDPALADYPSQSFAMERIGWLPGCRR